MESPVINKTGTNENVDQRRQAYQELINQVNLIDDPLSQQRNNDFINLDEDIKVEVSIQRTSKPSDEQSPISGFSRPSKSYEMSPAENKNHFEQLGTTSDIKTPQTDDDPKDDLVPSA